ncbi:MAG: ATP-binding protein [Pseudomonadota bacterium]
MRATRLLTHSVQRSRLPNVAIVLAGICLFATTSLATAAGQSFVPSTSDRPATDGVRAVLELTEPYSVPASQRYLEVHLPVNASAGWFRVRSPVDARYLAFENGAVLEIDVYLVSDGVVLKRVTLGLNVQRDPALVDTPGDVVKLPSAAGPIDVLVHQRASNGNRRFALRFIDVDGLASYDRTRHLWHGAFYGSIGLLTLFCWSAFLGSRRSELLSLSVYLVALAYCISIIDGFSPYYGLRIPNVSLAHLLPLGMAIAISADVAFLRGLLQFDRHVPVLSHAAVALQALVVLFYGSLVIDSSLPHYRYQLIFASLVSVVFILVGLYGLRARLPFAGIYLLSIILPLLIITWPKVLPADLSPAAVVMLAVILRLVVLSAQRTRFLRRVRVDADAAKDRQSQLLAQIRHLSSRTEDQTEQRELQRTLQHQQRLRTVGKIAAGVAHDFNNILTSISGFTELLEARQLDVANDRRSHWLKQIRASVDRGASLVRQLNIYSRDVRPRLATNNLSDAVERTIRLIRSGAPPGIRITSDLGGEPLYSRLNPAQIEQVVSNLALNAIEAMGPQGHLSITLAEVAEVTGRCVSCQRQLQGPKLVIEINDSGPGIEGNPADLFTPFATGTNDGSRSGMGLSVVHGIVHEHGGHLQLGNRADGKGCRAAVLLPRSSGASTTEFTAIEERLLLIRPDLSNSDDDLAGLRERYMVDVAATAAEALEQFIEHRRMIRLVIIDVREQVSRWYDLAVDMRDVDPQIPLLVLDYDFNARHRDEIDRLGAAIGTFAVGNPANPGWSLTAAVLRTLNQNPAAATDLEPLLRAWRSSR